jgi:predicted dithiol-disulfide oxidoreductase (DUF899 family)
MNDQLVPATALATKAKTPFPGASADYETARKALLAEEIEFRRHMTRLAEQRRALPPGPVIRKNYRFKDEQGFEVGSRSSGARRWKGNTPSRRSADGAT